VTSRAGLWRSSRPEGSEKIHSLVSGSNVTETSCPWNRNVPVLVHASNPDVAREVCGDPAPLPTFGLRLRQIGPARVGQAGVIGKTAQTFAVGVDLAVEPVHRVQARLERRGRLACPGLAPAVAGPLRPFHNPVLLGTTRPVPDHLDAQADQPQPQLGREIPLRTPGRAVVDPHGSRQAPLRKGETQLPPNLVRWDLIPPPLGGKPRSGAPRRCIHQPVEANLPIDLFLF
jgi:hypothetical protein